MKIQVPQNKKFSLVVAMTNNGVIAKANGDLPFDLEADKENYKALIKDKIYIQGRKSHENSPSDIKTRLNIVLTSKSDYSPRFENSKIASSIQEAIGLADEHSSEGEEIFIGGGLSLYSDALSFADTLYITQADIDFVGGGSFFPAFNLDKWRPYEIKPFTSSDGVKYSIKTYHCAAGHKVFSIR